MMGDTKKLVSASDATATDRPTERQMQIVHKKATG